MRIQRFDAVFLKDFFQPLAAETVAPVKIEEPPPPPPPPTFNQAQLEDAKMASRKDGFAEGFEAGFAEAQAMQAAHEEAVGKAVQSIASTLEVLHKQYQTALAAQQQEVGGLALMMAKKIAGASLHTDAVPMMEAMVSDCVPMVFGKPRITIELHSDMVEQAHERLKTILQRQGYEGDIALRANNQLGQHDVRVDWASGHAERKMETLWNELETLVQRFTQPQPTQE